MNPHGGVRAGAGRKKLSSNVMNEQARMQAVSSGETPLEFLLKAMRNDQNEFSVRLDAAKAAAPYIHARLSAIDMTSKTDGTIRLISDKPMSENDWANEVGMGSSEGAASILS